MQTRAGDPAELAPAGLPSIFGFLYILRLIEYFIGAVSPSTLSSLCLSVSPARVAGRARVSPLMRRAPTGPQPHTVTGTRARAGDASARGFATCYLQEVMLHCDYVFSIWGCSERLSIYMHAEYSISGRRTRVCLRAAASRCACSCLASFSFTIAAPGCPLRLNLDVGSPPQSEAARAGPGVCVTEAPHRPEAAPGKWQPWRRQAAL